MDYLSHYASPLGEMTLGSNGAQLFGLWFEDDRHFCDAVGTEWEMKDSLPVFRETARWLDVYFSGHQPDFTPPLTLRGTVFRRQVWKELLAIPYGETRTYGELAKKIAADNAKAAMSAQAIGGAVGHNPISLIIPCHRVIGAKGDLTGYGGGLWRKRRLLELEGHRL